MRLVGAVIMRLLRFIKPARREHVSDAEGYAKRILEKYKGVFDRLAEM
ncbi:MAG: hypothetical protein HYU39_06885 [Thaumarchaeota archaeon]|nr:hypothetical protein [Nitrososphaerota archaeon]